MAAGVRLEPFHPEGTEHLEELGTVLSEVSLEDTDLERHQKREDVNGHSSTISRLRGRLGAGYPSPTQELDDMTTITDRTFDGGTGIGRGSGTPNLATTLQEVADDLAALNAAANRPATIASTDATDLPEVITLANEIKAALNAVVAPSILTIRG